jgi:hypothetical protein
VGAVKRGAEGSHCSYDLNMPFYLGSFAKTLGQVWGKFIFECLSAQGAGVPADSALHTGVLFVAGTNSQPVYGADVHATGTSGTGTFQYSHGVWRAW